MIPYQIHAAIPQMLNDDTGMFLCPTSLHSAGARILGGNPRWDFGGRCPWGALPHRHNPLGEASALGILFLSDCQKPLRGHHAHVRVLLSQSREWPMEGWLWWAGVPAQWPQRVPSAGQGWLQWEGEAAPPLSPPSFPHWIHHSSCTLSPSPRGAWCLPHPSQLTASPLKPPQVFPWPNLQT